MALTTVEGVPFSNHSRQHLECITKMLSLAAWSSADLYEVLQFLRTHMVDYMYSSDEDFEALLQQKLQPEPAIAVMDVVRELMRGFAFALSTRCFRNEEITVDNKKVYPHEHLYETMAAQLENRKGGVWHPDELRRLLTKIKTYRHEFDKNQETFFARSLIWSKTVRDVRIKFYLWRDIYTSEKGKNERSEGQLKRIQALHGPFKDVPPEPEPTQTAMSLPGAASVSHRASKPKPSMSPRPPKIRIWTPEDLEQLLELLSEVTLEIHKTGHSLLVHELSVRLLRTEQSLVTKLQDMRDKFENKKTTGGRAAHLPSVLYDESSLPHKIFSSDWSDRDDPYALGYRAIKDMLNKTIGAKNYAKRHRPPPLQMEMRKRTPTGAASPDGQSPTLAMTPTSMHEHKPATKPEQTSSLAQPRTYSEFVRECATTTTWDEAKTLAVCLAMQQAMPLYESGKRQAFYAQVANEVESLTPPDAFLYGALILRLCQQRYGSIDCFAAAVEGSDPSNTHQNRCELDQPTVSSDLESVETNPEVDTTTTVMATITTTTTDTTTISALSTPTEPAAVDEPLPVSPSPISPTVVDHLNTPASKASTTSLPPIAPCYGKSNDTTKQTFDQKAGQFNRKVSPAVESSPSVHHFSPENNDDEEDDFEDADIDTFDGDAAVEDHEGQGGDTDRMHDDEHDKGADTESLASNDTADSSVSTDYGNDKTIHPPPCPPTPPRPSTAASSRVHIAARKTVVFERARCHCCRSDCCHATQQRESEETAMGVHCKRSHQEYYASYGEHHSDRRHEVVHKQFHYPRATSSEEEDRASCDCEKIAKQKKKKRKRAKTKYAMMAVTKQMWTDLFAPIHQEIAEMKVRLMEQEECKRDRERREKKKRWKQEVRQQLHDEYTGMETSASRRDV